MRSFRRSVAIATLLIASVGFIHAQQPVAPSKTTQNTTASKAAAKASAATPAVEPMDINTASADQLKTIPGIGDAYAKRIVDGRPYSAKNQLATKGILPQGVYDKVKDQIVAHRPAKK